jgi:outer membrane protein assembly factor BamA
VGHLDPAIGTGTDRRMPSTEAVFAPDVVPGFAAQPSFVVLEPFVEFHTTDPRLNPTTGGSYRFTVRRYGDRDLRRFSFTAWDLDLRQYVPLLHRTRTLAFRAWLSSSHADDGQEVPFYLQPTLGGGYSLRGFPSFRFRDRSLLLLQGEYRWRVNEFVTGALFYEAGGVAPRLGDLDRFERSYGFGLRAGSRDGVAFRADVAFGSGEGTRLLVRFDNVF